MESINLNLEMKYLIALFIICFSKSYCQSELNNQDFQQAKKLYIEMVHTYDYNEMVRFLDEFKSKLPIEIRDVNFTTQEEFRKYIFNNIEKSFFDDKEQAEKYILYRDEVISKVIKNNSEFYELFKKCSPEQLLEIMKNSP
ncbi:hypothetical protein HYN48_14180 [Flavobacterium magnum]|uniref:DUF4296 domain-containing protein n=2 Tax=Flavobacterium magnum TaxID=2162713 RepID=A0A2S0RIV6_9FLAO|nr:hypothetical protein HYN48_14180 [Flavobacterium magnum]